MKVGDYVRTKNGKIIKVGREELYDINLDSIKSSPNIIDLIEVGDYVNGKRVTYKNIEKKIIYIEDEYQLKNKDIKSIVTKDQFSQMEYKIQ